MLREKTGLGEQLHAAHAPERVLPGKILREVVENDRILGGVDEPSTRVVAAFYETFVTGELLLTDARTAETAKLIENAYRDVNIAFANEVSFIADELGIDVWKLIELANHHPRVEILRPGPGVGGHCIAVDPWFLVAAVPGSTRLIRTAREVNDGKPAWVVERVRRRAGRFKNPRIACLGLAYKPNVDDLRESPAIDVVRGIRDANLGELRVVEPHVPHHEEFDLLSAEAALDGADIVVLLVAHDRFRKLPRKVLEEKVVIDVCGLFR
jgi:UDP-N-acetyl-D-mannosaminuronic acid dehydrogenase